MLMRPIIWIIFTCTASNISHGCPKRGKSVNWFWAAKILMRRRSGQISNALAAHRRVKRPLWTVPCSRTLNLFHFQPLPNAALLQLIMRQATTKIVLPYQAFRWPIQHCHKEAVHTVLTAPCLLYITAEEHQYWQLYFFFDAELNKVLSLALRKGSAMHNQYMLLIYVGRPHFQQTHGQWCVPKEQVVGAIGPN